MFNVLDQALFEVFRFDRGATVNKAGIPGLVQTKSVAGIIVKTVHSSTNFIFPTKIIVLNLINRVIDKYCLRELDELSALTVGTGPPNERLARRPKNLSRLRSEFRFENEKRRSRHSSSLCKCHEK